MFAIKHGNEGELILVGRLDAARADDAAATFDAIEESTVVDMASLDYISSMGLGLLVKTQKRLRGKGDRSLKLVNVNPHIHDIFQFSGFHHIFEIEVRPTGEDD